VLRGAILGVGQVALHGHVPGWLSREDVAIVAGADANAERRDAFRAAFPQASWYDAAEALFERETIDFVDICTPPASHGPLSRLALDRSVHVLCEKPLVLAPEELRGLPALAAERERVVFTVHNWKHAPILGKAAELVRSALIGDVRRVRWETLRERPASVAGDEPNWRVDPSQSGGGVLADHGWHALYVIQQWMRAAPLTVAAALETRKHKDWPVEDTADLFLAYPSASAEIFLTWAADERANRADIEGTRGRIRMDGGRLALFGAAGADPIEEWRFPALTEGSHHPDWFGGVIGDFFDEIATPALRGRNLAEASLCAHVLSLARESNRRASEPLSAGRIAVPVSKT